MPSLARRCTAEMIGTGFLVFFGCASVIMNAFPGAGFNVFGIAMVHAFVLSLGVSMTMGISGGHLNPAVTIGLLSVQRITLRDAFAYVVSQLAGALVAAFIVRAAVAPNVGAVAGFGTPHVSSDVSFPHAIFLEAIFAFLLMSGVMGTIVSPRGPKIGGFGVGLTLIPIVMVGAPLTGGVANPARAFGPAVVALIPTAQAVWWIGPILGAIAAALLWHHIILAERTETIDEIAG